MEPLDRGVVTGTAVWPALLEFLEHSPGRKVIASAFIGSDGATLLHSLGKGDLLICNASRAALMQGSTYPSALRTLVKRGVTVRSVPNLHAKVYIAGDRAFIGSANVSGTSTTLYEAGIFIDDPSQVAHLLHLLENLSSSPDTDRVTEAFLDLADRTFRSPRATIGHAARGVKALGAPLWFWAFGDESAPASVEAAARSQRDEYQFPTHDAAATYEWSWGTKGSWKEGQRCVWVERTADEPDSWVAQPPSECLAGYEVGGRSKQWIYWWRTPTVSDQPWRSLRAHVLAATGRSLLLDSSTRDAAVLGEVERFFGLGFPVQ